MTVSKWIFQAIPLLGLLAGCQERVSPTDVQKPSPTGDIARFELHQPELFAEKGSHTNAWADFDNDGDLDLYVGFGGNPSPPNRLYRNDGGNFTDVAAEVGLADTEQTRAVGWGDYDGDGHLDVYVGFSGGSSTGPSLIANRLYRNDGRGEHFTDVTQSVGVELPPGGVSRQISWVDYDNDRDVDLFVAFRDRPDVLFRNDGGTFTDVSKTMGLVGSRASMGAVWFDFDEDGDLDVYLANMDGHANSLYRNDGTQFVDVAPELGVDSGGREILEEPALHAPGSIRPDLIDFDNDGDLDIYVTNLGTVDGLYRNDGEGRYVNVAHEVGLTNDGYRGTASWADFDNDGLQDVFVNGILFRNEEDRFTDVTPEVIKENVGGYGVQWADFDSDGDLDLALSSRNHYVIRNLLPAERARSSLQIMLLDAEGRHTRAGSEIRLYAAGTDKLLGTRIVESGSGYCSQNVMPVHFGLGDEGPVDVEITTLTRQGRKVARLQNVDPRSHTGGFLVVKVDADGDLVR
jgi:hypothetical protein